MERSMPAIFEAIRAGENPYRAMAAQRFMKPIEDVTHEECVEVKMRVIGAIAGITGAEAGRGQHSCG